MVQVYPADNPSPMSASDAHILETGTSASPYSTPQTYAPQETQWKFGQGLTEGSMAAKGVNYAGTNLYDFMTVDQHHDPNYNVYGERTPQFLQEHSWADQWFDSHEPDSIPNADVFHNMVARKDLELQHEQEWSSAAAGSGIGGWALDFGATLGVGSALKIGRALPTIGETALELAGMSTAQRVGWSALKGAAINLTINEASNALRYNPGATGMDRIKGDAVAAGLGAVLGGAAGKLVEMGQIKQVQRFQAGVTRAIAESGGVNGWPSAIAQHTDELNRMLKETPLGDNSFTGIKTPETLPLMDELQAAYEKAGHEMTFLDHPAQGDFDHFGPGGTLDELRQNLSKLVPKAAKFGELTGATAPGSRMANDAIWFNRMLHRTLFTEARPTSEMANNPLSNAAPTNAEALKLQLRGDSQRVTQGLYDSTRQYFKGGGAAFSTDTLEGPVDIRRASDWQKLSQAIDYHRQLSDLADRGGPAAPEPHPLVAENFQRFSEFYQKRQGELEGVGALEGPEALQGAKDKLAELKAEKPKPAEPLPPPITGPSPIELYKSLREANADVRDAMEAQRDSREYTKGPFTDAFEAAKTHRDAIAKSIQEQLPTDARKLEPWQLTKRQFELKLLGNRAINQQIDNWRESLADDSGIENKPLDQDGIATTHRQLVSSAIAEGKPVSRLVLRDYPEIEPPPTPNPNADRIQAMEQDVAERQKTVDRARFYSPRRWLIQAVQRGQVELAAELERQFHANRETNFHTQQPINPATRPIMPELAQRVATATGGDASTVFDGLKTEGDIKDPAMAGAYQQAVDDYAASASKAAVRHILEMDRYSGIQSLADSTSSPMARRVMTDLDETKVSKFLDNDALNKIERYDAHASGRIGLGQAIQRSPHLADMQDVVQRLTGEKLDPAAPDAELLKLTSQNAWKELSKTIEPIPAGSLKDELTRQLETAQGRSNAAFPAKINELMGMPAMENAGLSANWRRIQNIFLRLPIPAFLGSSVLSHLTNFAGAMMTKAPARVLAEIVSTIAMLKEADPRAAAWLQVSAADDGRTPLELCNLPTMMDREPTETTGTGRAIQMTDKATDWLARKTIQLSGTNYVTNVMRRVYANQLMQDFFQNLKGMAGAQDAIDAGASEQDAVGKFMKPEDATRMSRLGIGGKDAQKLLEIIQARGVDTQTGAPLSALSPEDFQNYQRHISPEFGDWDSSERVLRDKLAAAVNQETNNLVVRPTLTSKPLINNTFMGRLFNQFWAYHLAWGNQSAIMAGASPARQQAAYFTTLMFLGAVSDALHNSLSGRRSLDETAQMWGSNPLGMAYQAAGRAGVLGWGNRLLNFADATPYGPAHALGNTISSQHAAQVLSPAGLILGPSGDYANRLVEGGLLPLVNGKGYNDRARHVGWSAVPLHNLIWLTAPYRAMEAFGLKPPMADYIAPQRPQTVTPQP